MTSFTKTTLVKEEKTLIFFNILLSHNFKKYWPSRQKKTRDHEYKNQI